MTVPVERFGKDHWSVLAYLECCAVDDGGRLDVRHMRCDADRHPGLVDARSGAAQSGRKYPTILAGGEKLADHDDWDCVDDLEAAGLVEQVGTGVHPVVKLTDEGLEVAAALRAHKARGGYFAQFRWPAE